MHAKQHVIDEALRLSEADRLEVVEALYESLEAPLDPSVEQAWSVEIERRLADQDAGQVRPIPWSEARAKIPGGEGDAASS
jgi:putative addiction module component (TIGR02574 family)